MTLQPGWVAVIGQGYVGLPLAIAAAECGYMVIGIDNDSRRVDALNSGISPVGDISDSQLRAVLAAGSYSARASFDDVNRAEIVILCVPTPYHHQAPDMSFIESAVDAVGSNIASGALVILESTTYPGTTEELVLPLLEERSGLTNGKDFELAFSPERIDPGNQAFGVHNTPKIVGGMTSNAAERAAAFYGRFVERVVTVSSPSAAEMTKLLENTFRHINIALANELAVICRDMAIDVWEVIDAAASKPFGFMPFYPGPGVGGHCIPVDPMYLSWRVKQFGGSARFIELAREINDAMPLYCLTRIQDLLNDRGLPLRGSRIVIFGVAYKANVADVRESPAIPLIDALLDKGSTVEYFDAFVPTITIANGRELASMSCEAALTTEADCIVLITPHTQVDYERLISSAPLIFDTRNHLKSDLPNVVKL